MTVAHPPGKVEAVCDLLKDCGTFYADASDQLRRQMNQAFFDKVLVDDEGVVAETKLLQPFKTIKALQTQKHRQATNLVVTAGARVEPDNSFSGVNGSEQGYMVEHKGR